MMTKPTNKSYQFNIRKLKILKIHDKILNAWNGASTEDPVRKEDSV